MDNIKNMLQQCVSTTTANVTLIDNQTGLQLFSKTMKDVGVDFKESTKDIKGGIGNKKLYSWGTDRETEVSLSDAVDRLDWTAAKFGQMVKEGSVRAWQQAKTYTVSGGKITLEVAPADSGELRVYDKKTGNAIESPKLSDKVVTFSGVTDGQEVYVLGYNISANGLSIDIQGDKFAQTFEVIISTPLVMLTDGKAETKFIKQYRFPMGRLKGEFKDDMKSDSDGGEHSTTIEILDPNTDKNMGGIIYFAMDELTKDEVVNMGLAPASKTTSDSEVK